MAELPSLEEVIRAGVEKALKEPIVDAYNAKDIIRIAQDRWCETCYLKEQKEAGGWISVKDRLPEEDGLYNVYCKDGSMAHAWFEDKWFIDHCECGDGYITHWMPLPEPPKET